MYDVEILDIIDMKNKVIGRATKEEAYKNKLSHRIVHVMVCHSDKIFLSRRSMNVRYLPGHYCSSAAGHVISGESSHEGALRELQEEIGLSGPIRFIKEFFYEHDFIVHTSIFLKKFSPDQDKIELNYNEVMSGEFYSFAEIELLDTTQFHPQLQFCIDALREYL